TADIFNAALFYSGSSDYTYRPFDSADSIGKIVSKPNGAFSFTTSKNLQEGTNYFWLTYDISASASIGNYVDATLDSVIIADTMRYPTVANPTGSRIIEPFATYCGISIVAPNSSNSNFVGITRVKIGNAIDNSSPDKDGLTFYQSPRFKTYRQNTVGVEIKYGMGFDEQIIGWVDWNNDGFFDETTEEVFYTTASTAGETYRTNFTVPCSATVGTHKIRIASDDYKQKKPSPCSNLQFGDAEEYVIEIQPDITPTAKFVLDTPAYIYSDILFTNASTAEGNIVYSWDLDNNGTTDFTGKNAIYSFNTIGWKKVKLTLTDNGCSATVVKTYLDSFRV
ncbi:MAG TPA: GEVED domain-containing protein, partial [Niastella sp.]|nr:GEVED domain-containing protein [Niastella sp.]